MKQVAKNIGRRIFKKFQLSWFGIAKFGYVFLWLTATFVTAEI
jgi:hypothetical protein